MKRILSSALCWMVAVCLLIALVAPSTSIGRFAVKALIVGIATLAVVSVFQLISTLIAPRPERGASKQIVRLAPTWRPGNHEQAEDRCHRISNPDKDQTDTEG